MKHYRNNRLMEPRHISERFTLTIDIESFGEDGFHWVDYREYDEDGDVLFGAYWPNDDCPKRGVKGLHSWP